MVTGHENDRHASIRIGRCLTFTHGSSDFFLCLLRPELLLISLIYLLSSALLTNVLTGFVMDVKPQITWFPFLSKTFLSCRG